MHQNFTANRWSNVLNKAARWLDERPNAIVEKLEVDEGDYPSLTLHYRYADDASEEEGSAIAQLERVICSFVGYGNAKSLTANQRRRLTSPIIALENNKVIQRPSLLEQFQQNPEAFVQVTKYLARKAEGRPSATKLISALRTYFEHNSTTEEEKWN